MQTAYLGIDTGSISTKGVIIDENNKILAADYIWTEGDPIGAVKKIVNLLRQQINERNISIFSIGTTGSARKLIGVMLGAKVVKNEITAHAIGTLSVFPDVQTIFEIGGQDSKIILIDDGVVVDYAMNTICAAGTGSFLSSQAKRLGMEVTEFGEIALASKNPSKLAARCTVFAESDMVHKAQIGHKKEDIIAGLCTAVVANYLNNVGKGKRIKAPIVFQGGVSKNAGVIRAFEEATHEKIHVDPNSHLMGALGVAILSKKAKRETPFPLNISDITYETMGYDCKGCPNHCEIICFYKDGILIDSWGNRCANGNPMQQSLKNA
ncbi:acyl-CoA dehydratase activase [Sinanaerobacter sp. ZZT-01]|uniref:acyl-CoA dehydratase activase n=1 Tax=Sinanaerobacter sp. ZZT-01 TaxID=3111540 RepID=UPI002D79B150|nr:acyl-CoA dehydratase activase [Sinanaerobacter sp. ZZT-01]WRR93638.1 acyl-CoA dehydratase activase [Sinanaerobacter sp. ZZT-01]